MKSILFTGYEPFGDWDVNPTAEAVKALDGNTIDGYTIYGHVLQLGYHTIAPQLDRLVNKQLPNAIVLSGQAGGNKIRLEQIAVNEATTKMGYNCGSKPDREILVTEGANQHISSLPLEKIFGVLQQNKIPVRYSEDAGKFGCNQVFYLARHNYANIPSGFIHVPLLKSQASDENYMEQELITKALELVLQTTAIWLDEKE